jgi:hypothetical protein
MRSLIWFALFIIAVIAAPVALKINPGNHLEKRGTDAVIADVVKAAIMFGALIWGGGVVSKRAINYYFQKKQEVENQIKTGRFWDKKLIEGEDEEDEDGQLDKEE